MRLFYFLLLISIFNFAGCISAPHATFDSSKKKGSWETKVQVRDLKAMRSHHVSIDFFAIQPDQLRAEVAATLGISVASLAIDKNKITYAVHTQKKFYQGLVSESALEPLLKIRMNPKILFYVLFDRPLPTPQWNCKLNSVGLPDECRWVKGGYEITWSERREETKRISIRANEFELQILVKSFSPELPTKVEKDLRFFTVDAPESYEIHQL